MLCTPVTSFVSSYIKNLQESSLPSKLELQGLVADEEFNDPYHTDFRQFSKNFEASAFYPDGNFGTVANWKYHTIIVPLIPCFLHEMMPCHEKGKFNSEFLPNKVKFDLLTGMGLDSNLIFSQDSYIPRSASLNLTVDLFGESVNLMEVMYH